MRFEAGETVRIVNTSIFWLGKLVKLKEIIRYDKAYKCNLWLGKIGASTVEIPESEMEKITPLEQLL